MNITTAILSGSLLLVSSLAACGGDGGDQPASALQAQVDALARTGVVGVQAETRGPDGSHWAGAGVARLSPPEALQPRSRFRIGSTTKAFVATVALQLVQEGTLSLDDTVERWLPGLVQGPGYDGGRITLRHLLQHTSGLPDYVEDHEALLMAVTSLAELRALLLRPWTAAQMVALALTHPPVVAPGTRWSYSNTGYVVAGMIIERATGKPWDQQVTERIIAPLALADTYAPGANPSIVGPYAHGYLNMDLPGQTGPVDVTELNPTVLDAEGALVSTVGDLDRFFMALLRGELLGSALLGQMKTTIPVDAEHPGVGYGLGLVRFPLSCGGGYWNHPGDVIGYHARGGVDDRGDRGASIAATGEGEIDEASNALIDAALCP